MSHANLDVVDEKALTSFKALSLQSNTMGGMNGINPMSGMPYNGNGGSPVSRRSVSPGGRSGSPLNRSSSPMARRAQSPRRFSITSSGRFLLPPPPLSIDTIRFLLMSYC